MKLETIYEGLLQYEPSTEFKAQANIHDQSLYQQAKNDRLAFWEAQAKNLKWQKPWTKVLDWKRPQAKWFIDGKLNACENCLDRHLENRAQKAALIWEGERGEKQTLTYQELYEKVCHLAHHLKTTFGVQKGDRVTLYLPMIPQLLIAVLACARIGAIHSVVFGGFSAKSIKDRILDSQSKIVITTDGGRRRGKDLLLLDIVKEALDKEVTCVTDVLVYEHLKTTFRITSKENYNVTYAQDLSQEKADCPPEPMDSEDILFILYTSGTTGQPKGIMHSTGGYLTHALYSTQAVFDLKEEDLFWCTADIGWITGHTYLSYGPLLAGASIFMYEGTPDYPNKDQFWKLIDSYQISILYTAPTAIRAFMKWGNDYPDKHHLNSLRLLGTVGEPINPEAWQWYYDIIGKKRCPIVDTWWQTETGGIMISTLPGLHAMKPGVAGKPLPGIEASILDQSGEKVEKGGGLLSLTQPWPSMLRGIWGDEKRFQDVYWKKFETYFAGDGATIDEEQYIKVLGRVDDVLNVAGHRIGTMEVESALVDYESVAEAAVVGIPDEIKGEAIVAFVILKEDQKEEGDLEKKLIDFVAKTIGAIAKPQQIILTPELPKTRSGKIMRRLLKDIASGQSPKGDTSTLANPDIVALLAQKCGV